MNMLIIGVLFIVALLAIGGAVWLAVGERQASARALSQPIPSIAASSPQEAATAAHGGPGTVASQRPATTPPPATVKPDNLVAPEPASPVAPAEQSFAALNGQFYELASELRMLHGEAQDIERRLSILTEMVSRIEREYGEVSLETE